MKLSLENLRNEVRNENERRLIAEFEYAYNLSQNKNKIILDELENGLDLYNEIKAKRLLTKNDVTKIESLFDNTSKLAKENKVICIGHAHIDLDWLWGFDETVNITVNTMETVVKLLEADKGFTFAQSQGYVYKILNDYRPDLLNKIKKFIKEGRFEVCAATFVEADKNLANGYAMYNQIQYNREYLSKILEIDVNKLDIDFEPDTFGHPQNTPELLNKFGIKYYYHCRGNITKPIYRWKKNDSEVLVYHEPNWYNASISYFDFNYVPLFCNENNVNTALKVYGVGDHGGGPTFEDIKLIRKMMDFPVFPTILFGTYHDFFNEIEKSRNQFEILEGEQSQIFSGCYTSQHLLKVANEKNQSNLYETEVFSSLAKASVNIKDAKERMLFNQFHDILPGSCTEQSTTYALANQQFVNAQCGIEKTKLIKIISKNIDTSSVLVKEEATLSLGAGNGFHNQNSNFEHQSTSGKTRGFIVYNSLNYERDEIIDIPLWDYEGNVNKIKLYDTENREIPFEIENSNPTFYWYHNFNNIKAKVKVPALGYSFVKIDESNTPDLFKFSQNPLVIEDEISNFILENDQIKYEFNRNFELISVFDKCSKEEKLERPSGLYLIIEDASNQMTAWIKGYEKSRQSLHTNTQIVPSLCKNGALLSTLGFTSKVNETTYTVTIIFEKCNGKLRYKIQTDFFEKGSPEGIPTLVFEMPMKKSINSFADTGFGIKKIENKNIDTAGLSFISNNDVQLFGYGKHGFKLYENTLSITLLRGSFNPHQYPEYGPRNISFFIKMNNNSFDCVKDSRCELIPLYVAPICKQKGTEPLEKSILYIEGNVHLLELSGKDDLSCILMNTNNNDEEVKFNFTHKKIYILINGKFVETKDKIFVRKNSFEIFKITL